MIRPLIPLFAIAAAAALVACGDKPSPPMQTNVSPAVSTPPAVLTPPPTAAGTNPAETAKDTAATNPKGAMSDAQESKSMPMSGQAGSHSSMALDTTEPPKK
ncbi:MAG: hypothetical protein U1F15_10485 [Burkholderiales bacterium]